MNRRPHSLALVLASMVPALTVVWTVDVVTPVLVGLAVFATLASALHLPRVPWPRVGALVVIALGTSVVSLLYAKSSGTVYLEWGFITVSDGSFRVALAAFARILAIGLPALLVFPAAEPHELIATTVVRKVFPQRAALAVLIAIRLVPVIAGDLEETRIARRSAGRTTSFSALIVTTLVIAIRRAIRMSEIAEVRGFSAPQRVWTSYRPFARADWTLLVIAVASGLGSLVITAVTGEWNSAI